MSVSPGGKTAQDRTRSRMIDANLSVIRHAQNYLLRGRVYSTGLEKQRSSGKSKVMLREVIYYAINIYLDSGLTV